MEVYTPGCVILGLERSKINSKGCQVMISRQSVKDLQDMAGQWFGENVSASTIDEAEEVILDVSKRLSEAMMSAFAEQMDPKSTYEGVRIDCKCGCQASFEGYRSRWVRTLCGDIRPKRAYYHCKSCHSGISPWDKRQGLSERVWSAGLSALVGELCARLTYAEVSQLLERVLGLGIEESSEQDIVGDLGMRLRAEELSWIEGYFERDEQIVPQTSADRLYVCVDAAKAHTDGTWHDIKTGVVFAGVEPDRDSTRKIDEMSQARYVAAQESSEQFGKRLYMRAVLSGLDGAGEVVVLGDGADWIWNESAMHFAGSVEILDYYHACEHIWSFGAARYGEGSAACKRWAQMHCRKLKANGPAGLLRALRRCKPKSPEEVEALRLELGYFESHRHRMDYPAYRACGMMIGSGPVEAACKVVVGQRLKQSGMRWTQAGADNILALRTAILSGEAHRIQRLARAA